MTDRPWWVRSYRSHPMGYAGISMESFPSKWEAESLAAKYRASDDYFCVEVRGPADPAYFWLGAQAEAA
jgi:hypothetical protein